ncbi:MAG: methylenetetrahydrofolate--tRNA-(uracil(54)-C(5))-methyltransferase (FADH(2)-oxidizing) TrmFO [Oligoflexales bacterium]|nr:methylenetetrahydrofolate--tRNA-(uracil(54)-C(5))-methyltransferase (FADH(2)-oxidizing) TrmFO [Oligoflexales bacterium]
MKISIIGGGLAGSEACYQLLKRGHSVELIEMRPSHSTPAHKTGNLAELVCSNSLKSLDESSAPGLLKKEMLALDSLTIAAAHKARVPAGQALAVDREIFSQHISQVLSSFDNFSRIDAEFGELPTFPEMQKRNEFLLIATGPLTSEKLALSLAQMSGDEKGLYFYDAIAPTIDADTIDYDHCFRASRYGKGDDDYLNIALSKEEYYEFIDAVIAAEKMSLHEFEKPKYFESCLPVEVMIERGRETLRFGPMKPVGLTDPKTGREPYAAIQLRQENLDGTMFSMVGFQTKMKWPEQKRVFSILPALKNADYLRYGTIHRNTYVHGPKVLAADLSLRANPRIFLAGQITGVEGYTESAAIGLLAALALDAKARDAVFVAPPSSSMLGALHDYVTASPSKDYQPMNCNFGILPAVQAPQGVKKLPKQARKQMMVERASIDFTKWMTM